jgi:streptogramin lyase
VPALGPVDWNGDGNTTDTHLALDIDCDFGGLTQLHGSDDWAWIHTRLTPPAFTSLSQGGGALLIQGVNLMAPATVIFAGGAEAAGYGFQYDNSGGPNTSFRVNLPVGARQGPIEVVTPEGKVESSQSVTDLFAIAQDPQAITTGPDGNLWFTLQQGNGIGRITPTGQITEFPVLIPTPTEASDPYGITPGPDGNLWFTEQQGDAIGRITPNGTSVNVFPLRTVGAVPEAITTGPDGNLWFTENQGNKIGRITPTGQITEFPIPTPFSHPTGIAAGPDGNLWFTEHFPDNTHSPLETGAGQIGRITPTGQITEFPTYTATSANVSPEAITAGPDGNLWFTFFGRDNGFGFANGVGRITPSGMVTQFLNDPSCLCGPVTPATSPFAITAGPDGGPPTGLEANIWFIGTDSGGEEFVGPFFTGSFPPPLAVQGGLTAGPDHNVWWIQNGNIWRVNLTSIPSTLTEFPLP